MVRQDAWNQDEDLLLAEVVLRHIREGGTQLAAFEEVGEKLSRTPAACGFRWNSSIRKKYESAIQLAKKQRKQLKKEDFSFPDASEVSVSVQEEEESQTVLQSIDEMVHFLLSKKEELLVNQEKSDLQRTSKQIELLLEENKHLEEELTRLKHEYEIVKNDYQLMINVMERASKRGSTQFSAK